MKKIIAVILAISFALSLAACGEQATGRDAMTKVDCSSNGYIIYVDSGWTVVKNGEYLFVQSSYNSDGLPDCNAIVTVASTECENITQYLNEYEKSLDSGMELKKNVECKIGEYTGERREYVSGESRYAIASFLNGGNAYSVWFVCSAESFDEKVTEFEDMLAYFELTEKSKAEETSVSYTGGKAESLNGDYSFGYSEGWGIIRHDGMITVKPEGGNATISVQVNSLSNEKSSYGAYDYWEEYTKELASVLPAYKVTKEFETEDEPRLDNVVACRKEYSATVNGVEYKFVQIICICEGYVYSIVFTASSEEYDKYVSEIDSVIASFDFE